MFVKPQLQKDADKSIKDAGNVISSSFGKSINDACMFSIFPFITTRLRSCIMQKLYVSPPLIVDGKITSSMPGMSHKIEE
jgi:hypothetical protein